jgi:hypothetical protein
MKSKFKNLNFGSINVLSKEEVKKVKGGYTMQIGVPGSGGGGLDPNVYKWKCSLDGSRYMTSDLCRTNCFHAGSWSPVCFGANCPQSTSGTCSMG